MTYVGDVIRQCLYIIFGSCGIISNSFVFYLCIKCKQLRFNAYFLAAALAATDILGGVAFVAAGISRFHVVLTNQTQTLICPWECIYVPSASIFALAYHAGPMMITLISLDRLLAVAAANFYFHLGKRYTIGLILFCVFYAGLVLAYWTYDMMYVVRQVPSVTKFCWGIYSEAVHLYDYYAPPTLVSASVLIMSSALIVLHLRNTVNGNTAQAIAAARNAKAASLLAFISFNTFLMWVVPEMFVAIIDSYGYDPGGWFAEVAPLLWMLQPLHGVTNLLIYFRKGSQFRKAYKDMTNQVNTGPVGSLRA